MSNDAQIVLHLEADQLKELDDWISRQPRAISRERAAQRLFETALGSDFAKGPRLSDGEKLIAAMIADMMKGLRKRGDIEPEFISSVVFDGHFWALDWQYGGLFRDQAVPAEAAEEVGKILTMWDQMINAFDQLSPPDKVSVEEKVGSTLDSFPGFDGNNETVQYGIAKLLVEKMDRFKHVKGATHNSHGPVLEGYRRMLKAYGVMKERNGNSPLTRDEILELITLQSDNSP